MKCKNCGEDIPRKDMMNHNQWERRNEKMLDKASDLKPNKIKQSF